jgi:pyridoxine 5-phosphate synthase
MAAPFLRLGVNIDHVATLRNARDQGYPDPVRAAHAAIAAGADGITAHLREDRRHIRDGDIEALKREIQAPLNFEIAATEEMIAIACRIRPHAACLVPEKRSERTTEGGLDIVGGRHHLAPIVRRLNGEGIRVSLFVEPEPEVMDAARSLGTPVVELHSGALPATRRRPRMSFPASSAPPSMAPRSGSRSMPATGSPSTPPGSSPRSRRSASSTSATS